MNHPAVPTSGPGGTVRSVSPTQPGAADLIRSIGLLADGPVRWGLPVPARKAGLYVVELGQPLPTPPIEMTRVGKWLEGLPDMRMDGEHPNSKALTARLASFWWPEATVLYAGATDRSIGGRVAAMLAHVPGDRQPHSDGQWLHLLRRIEGLGLRMWWAETTAPEESLDALLDAFAAGQVAPPNRLAGALALPWANTRRPTGERQVHGLVGVVQPAPPKVAEPARHVVDVAAGDADGARIEERGRHDAPRAGRRVARRPPERGEGPSAPSRPRRRALGEWAADEDLPGCRGPARAALPGRAGSDDGRAG